MGSCLTTTEAPVMLDRGGNNILRQPQSRPPINAYIPPPPPSNYPHPPPRVQHIQFQFGYCNPSTPSFGYDYLSNRYPPPRPPPPPPPPPPAYSGHPPQPHGPPVPLPPPYSGHPAGHQAPPPPYQGYHPPGPVHPPPMAPTAYHHGTYPSGAPTKGGGGLY